ncbi:hypothetical protein D3OALGA1CA_4909 [Olavius algarvensis associated proteobacterium Delta 3]|nr:hypothetical protein D3OALGB2SA_2193 [Olavius algarvensis associated proteobacterium Delta 3]CAB5158733.1 hypothetical protein D3OALGA1CA_4909 [Olavius algarvensis associated proteobacterium Delta 3]
MAGIDDDRCLPLFYRVLNESRKMNVRRSHPGINQCRARWPG